VTNHGLTIDFEEGYLGLNNPTISLEEKIKRLRRVVLVHSIIYYRLNRSIMPDAQFDEISYELASYQRTCPEFCMEIDYHPEAFEGYSGETAYHLPLYDGPATQIALWLLNEYDKRLERFKDAQSETHRR
jgi:hypothetical protein